MAGAINVTAFPRLHPKGTSSRFALRAPRRLAPHNDKSGVITVLTGACTSRQRCAGSGMPLPYNSGCGRRNCFKICNCQWRSVSAATDAIGLCVFSVARANCKCLPEIATAPSGPRNDKSGNLHGRRNCFKICNCQWRSGSAATDAIGLYVFAGSPFESAAVRRAGLSPPIQHLTILQRHYFT